jgi:hypothetical protein
MVEGMKEIDTFSGLASISGCAVVSEAEEDEDEVAKAPPDAGAGVIFSRVA